MALVEEPVFHMRTEELNNDLRLHALFDFLGIPSEARVYPKKRHYNALLTKPGSK